MRERDLPGVGFATAREIALKLLETCRIAAEPLTATDLAHGPVAALDPLFPVWAIASSDNTLQTVKEAAARVERGRSSPCSRSFPASSSARRSRRPAGSTRTRRTASRR